MARGQEFSIVLDFAHDACRQGWEVGFDAPSGLHFHAKNGEWNNIVIPLSGRISDEERGSRFSQGLSRSFPRSFFASGLANALGCAQL